MTGLLMRKNRKKVVPAQVVEKSDPKIPGLFIFVQRVYFMLRKTTRLYHPHLDFEMCARNKIFISQFSTFSKHDSKKRTWISS